MTAGKAADEGCRPSQVIHHLTSTSGSAESAILGIDTLAGTEHHLAGSNGACPTSSPAQLSLGGTLFRAAVRRLDELQDTHLNTSPAPDHETLFASCSTSTELASFAMTSPPTSAVAVNSSRFKRASGATSSGTSSAPSGASTERTPGFVPRGSEMTRTMPLSYRSRPSRSSTSTRCQPDDVWTGPSIWPSGEQKQARSSSGSWHSPCFRRVPRRPPLEDESASMLLVAAAAANASTTNIPSLTDSRSACLMRMDSSLPSSVGGSMIWRVVDRALSAI
eukprot:CAMPEP_0115847778 /NCGR_PEP_ID=MMETSP0287-20121206/10563_1 /TAXON_ID=412157 /ORGANISM="Chrysochromulina rotalis, Strain UIO044" /LENGTH=277 /DNA_ID=CAMNT_0003301633 /DNA_START=636 /DNA_END=1471 /DNA_ORIENTATION=+